MVKAKKSVIVPLLTLFTSLSKEITISVVSVATWLISDGSIMLAIISFDSGEEPTVEKVKAPSFTVYFEFSAGVSADTVIT